MPMSLRLRTLVVLLAASLALPACSQTQATRRYTRDQAAASLSQLEKVGLVIGEFPINGAGAVIDGDTIRIDVLRNTLRLLAIDTEETFKDDAERQAFARGWEQYKKQMRGDSERPVKMGTPLGEEATEWARAFFEKAATVRLERDHPGEIRGYFGRYLAYVFVEKDGRWVNYNLEIVRAGLSPYFTKYGRSRRFHREFEEAQRQAREAGLGIWNPNKQGYGDYDERLAWWNQRADTIARFEKQMKDQSDHIVLTRWDSLLKLEQRVGKQVVVLGSVNAIRHGDRGPTVVKLSRAHRNDFNVVFFDKDTFLASGIGFARGEYVTVRGVVSKYHDKRRNVDNLQIVVSLPGQVLSPSQQLEELLNDEQDADAESPGATVSEIRFTPSPPLLEDEPD
jgi:endonuclease YncB( thermonuclease family)